MTTTLVAGALRRDLNELTRWQARRHAMFWLAAQPDGMLEDIGISPSEIRQVVTCGRAGHPIAQAEQCHGTQ
jgi:uncharacterized protein YjiS (DUF1127 family)